METTTSLQETGIAMPRPEEDDAAARFLRDMLEREESVQRDKAIRYGLAALREAEEGRK